MPWWLLSSSSSPPSTIDSVTAWRIEPSNRWLPSLVFGVCVCQALCIGSDAWPVRGIQSRPDTNHLRSLFGPKTQQDYLQPSAPRDSAFNSQHHYTIGIFGITSDLHRTSVIGYRCYQSSDFDIGDYSSLFYFYPLTPTHAILYCSFLSPLSLRSHTHPMTLMMS